MTAPSTSNKPAHRRWRFWIVAVAILIGGMAGHPQEKAPSMRSLEGAFSFASDFELLPSYRLSPQFHLSVRLPWDVDTDDVAFGISN